MSKSEPFMLKKRIAVIGAGAAGLASMKYLLARKHAVTGYEIGSKVGGLWCFNNDSGRSSAYQSLYINTWRENARYSDHPFQEDVGFFPSHREMDRYFNTYADIFRLRDHIRFRSEVTSVAPLRLKSSAGEVLVWQVTANGKTETYDAVVVATGHLTEPNMPATLEEFQGRKLHAHDYKEPWPFKDERVLVMGTGNSGVDIAGDVCPVARHTMLAARSPELITPKFVFGVPLTRLELLAKRRWLPASAHLWVRRLATRIMHGRMEQWGFVTPKGRTHPISHATLINHIAYRRLTVKPGVTGAAGNKVFFVDGSAEEFDTVICATGYSIKFPFLPEGVPEFNEHGALKLFARAVPPQWPGLYFLGYFNTNGLSNIRMFEIQAEWIANLEAGDFLLPHKEAMWQDIERRKRWLEKRYPTGPRYAMELEPSPYLEILQRTAKEGKNTMKDKEHDTDAVFNRSKSARMTRWPGTETQPLFSGGEMTAD